MLFMNVHASHVLPGGRYSDASQVQTLIAPLMVTALIFLGLLALLCFFKRNYLQEKLCFCCVKQPPSRNEAGGMTLTYLAANGSVALSRKPNVASTENTGNKSDLAFCSHCRLPLNDDTKYSSTETRKITKLKERFGSMNKSVRQNSPSSAPPVNGPSAPPSGEDPCPRCRNKQRERRSLGSIDVTNVCLTLETSDVCHI